MTGLRLLAVAALIGSIFSGGLVTPARAAEQPAGGIGVVDIERVGREAAPYKAASDEIRKLQDSLNENLKEAARYTYLAVNETNELIGILDAKEPNATQKARLAELKKTAEDREKRFGELAQTQNPTPEQKKELQDLVQMRNDRERVLAELKQRYEQELAKKFEEIDDRLGKAVRDAIQEIAKQKNLAVVLAKQAVFVGGVDITDDVIKKLK